MRILHILTMALYLIALIAWGWLFTAGPLGPGKIIPGVL